MRKLVPIILIAALIAVAIYVVIVRSHREPGIEGPVLSVRFMDDSLGNAIVLKTPEGNTVVIDPPSGRASEALGNMLEGEHTREITVVLSNASSRDTRAAGLQQVAKLIRIIRPDTGSSGVIVAPKNGAIPETVVARGDRLKLSPTVRIEVMNPARGTMPREEGDGSLVFRVTFGDQSILFPSDIRTEGESALIKSRLDLTSNVLVAGRHGQYGSSSLELLSMVRPEVIVVSARRGPSRPSASVLNRLSVRNTGAALYRTDKDGIIEIDTDGRSIQVLTGGGGL